MTESIMNKKEDILLDIEEKLKEEKWTRAAIESYSVKNFVELDSTIRIAIDEDFKDDLKALCKEHIKQSQNSVVGLYVIGILSLEESSIDDTHIPQIIKLFTDNKKHNVAEFLAEKILSYRESKFALKTLEMIYELQGEEDELFNVKKRLVLIDSYDATNAKYLGEHYVELGDKELAMFYYRLAIERYIKSKSMKMIAELWDRIVKLYPDDIKLIIQIMKKIRDVLGDEKVADMAFSDVIKFQIKKEKYRSALMLLKLAVDLKPHDKQIRKAIADCYRHLYADHSQLEKYLKVSAIGQSWKPHREAIRQFESHIAFDKGSFVSHKSWGIGVVKDIENDMVTIDFDGKPEHKMSLKIALRSLSVLDDDNIKIWKSHRKDELRQLMDEEPIKVLEIILKSTGGQGSSKDIKAVVVPDILEDKEWTRWWTKAKKTMADSNTVIQSLTKRNVIELRDTEMTVVEELVSRFKKTTNFENKLKLMVDFINRGGDINSEIGGAVVSYFTETINASSESNERKLLSYTVLKYANYEKYKDSDVDNSTIFGVKNLVDLFENLDFELKKPLLLILQKKLKDWELRFSEFIVHSTISKTHNFMFKELVIYEKYDEINTVFLTAMNNFQENPELFIWLARFIGEEEGTVLRDQVGIKEADVIFRLVSLVDIMNHEIEQKSNVGRNKKVLTAINDILFKNKLLDNFVEECDETVAHSLYFIMQASNTMENEEREKLSARIIERFPVLEKQLDKPEAVKIRHPFMVTPAVFEAKKLELNRMMTEDIPENSRAIGEAMEKGDLRENAEYKAALEKQDQLKAAAAKLESELNQAKIIDKNMVQTDTVDMGVKVTLEETDGNKAVYQILGQWEVDFEKGIISYHSPFGRALLDKKVGDEVEFEFNGEKKHYKVLAIEVADFD